MDLCYSKESVVGETPTTRKEYLNELYDAPLITVGVVALSMAPKTHLVEKLTAATPTTDIAKLALGFSVSSVMVKYAQDKKWVPVDPFKSP